MKCDYCGKEFEPRVKRQRFCCNLCRGEYHRLKYQRTERGKAKSREYYQQHKLELKIKRCMK